MAPAADPTAVDPVGLEAAGETASRSAALATPSASREAAVVRRCHGVEDYAHDLELQLARKSALLQEAVRLHQSLEQRLVSLETGLSWKDTQLEVLARQQEESNQGMSLWRDRAERLEEENCALRDCLLEMADENETLKQLLEAHAAGPPPWRPHGVSTASDDNHAMAECLVQQLKDTSERNVLLEEQLRLRSGSEPLGRAAPELDTAPELGTMTPAEAFSSVGLGAADRICGHTPPHCPLPRPSVVGAGVGDDCASAGSLHLPCPSPRASPLPSHLSAERPSAGAQALEGPALVLSEDVDAATKFKLAAANFSRSDAFGLLRRGSSNLDDRRGSLSAAAAAEAAAFAAAAGVTSMPAEAGARVVSGVTPPRALSADLPLAYTHQADGPLFGAYPCHVTPGRAQVTQDGFRGGIRGLVAHAAAAANAKELERAGGSIHAGQPAKPANVDSSEALGATWHSHDGDINHAHRHQQQHLQTVVRRKQESPAQSRGGSHATPLPPSQSVAQPVPPTVLNAMAPAGWLQQSTQRPGALQPTHLSATTTTHYHGHGGVPAQPQPQGVAAPPQPPQQPPQPPQPPPQQPQLARGTVAPPLTTTPPRSTRSTATPPRRTVPAASHGVLSMLPSVMQVPSGLKSLFQHGGAA